MFLDLQLALGDTKHAGQGQTMGHYAGAQYVAVWKVIAEGLANN